MKKELITKIKCMLDFIEEYDTLVAEAQAKGDWEWENELGASLCHAESGLRECVAHLLGDEQEEAAPVTDGEPPF